MKKKNASLDNHSRNHHRSRRLAYANPRILDYLRILNCDRGNAASDIAENHQHLYRLLFRNMIKRLAVTLVLCALCLPRISNAEGIEAISSLKPAPSQINSNL
jgi:hypothetical protein